jgi:hypothetical protein
MESIVRKGRKGRIGKERLGKDLNDGTERNRRIG